MADARSQKLERVVDDEAVQAPPARAATTATYDAAADHFDHPAVSFWTATGRETIARLALAPGAAVLDVGPGDRRQQRPLCSPRCGDPIVHT